MIPSIPTSYKLDAHQLERIDWWVFFVWIDAHEAQYRVACTMCDLSATLLNVHLGSIVGLLRRVADMRALEGTVGMRCSSWHYWRKGLGCCKVQGG